MRSGNIRTRGCFGLRSQLLTLLRVPPDQRTSPGVQLPANRRVCARVALHRCRRKRRNGDRWATALKNNSCGNTRRDLAPPRPLRLHKTQHATPRPRASTTPRLPTPRLRGCPGLLRGNVGVLGFIQRRAASCASAATHCWTSSCY